MIKTVVFASHCQEEIAFLPLHISVSPLTAECPQPPIYYLFEYLKFHETSKENCSACTEIQVRPIVKPKSWIASLNKFFVYQNSARTQPPMTRGC